MKLRFRGNSIRLRLTRTEVKNFLENGLVEDRVEMGVRLNQCLKYSLQMSDRVGQIECAFYENVIKVIVPESQGRLWASGEDVSLTNLQINSGESQLRILVEKDFSCLVDRPFESDDDAFAHPNAK